MGEPVRIDLADTWMGGDATPGDIFRASQKEFGRCISRAYIDTAEGVKAIGWVFVKRDRYEDTGETFLHETWVTLLTEYDARPRVTYHELPA